MSDDTKVEDRKIDPENPDAGEGAVEGLAPEDQRPTDLYTRINTAHGSNGVLRQNPVTFAEDIERFAEVPTNITDPRPEAEPPAPPEEVGVEARSVEGEEDEEATSTPQAVLYPNPAHPMGTPEDLLYAETGKITTTVGGADGMSIVEVDPEATEVEGAVAGDAAEVDEGGEVEQVESDYDPGEHTVAEVNDYIEEHPEEADAIYAAEEAGKGRAGILG